MKHIIWMAVIALTATTWSACSNEDEPTAAEQPAQSRTYTVTTTLSPRNGAATRSTMTDNGDGSINAEWQVNDQIYVRYINTSNEYVTATAEVTAVNSTTKAATITVSLTDPKNSSTIFFGYPLSHYAGTKHVETDQLGTLADINANHASIYGSGELTVDGSNVTLPAVAMDPEMCIWKFTFTDGSSDITSAITKLVIDFPGTNQTYTVTPSSQSNIYVAMYGVNAMPINIYAKTATGVYRKSAASVTLTPGTTYTTTGLALSSAVAANAVAGDLGKVIGADGNIYLKADIATAIGTTARAMITYVGNSSGESSPYNHGLALALSDANDGNKCKWCIWKIDAGHTKQNSSSFTIESGLQYNDATHNIDSYPAFKTAMANNGIAAPTGCSAWFLPTGYQWNQMLSAVGGYQALRTGFTNVGGTNMQTNYYWVSSEGGSERTWCYALINGEWLSVSKDGEVYVRSALAF